MTRRIAGVLFSMLLLLNLAPRGIECTEHASHEGETASIVAAGEGAADASHHEHGPVDKPVPCDATDKSDCCNAVESCSTAHALRSSQASGAAPAAIRSVSLFAATPPAYLIRPPEPPPPKA